MTERYLRSIEARLVLHDQLLKRMYVETYFSEAGQFERMIKSLADGIPLIPLPQKAEQEEEAIELRLAIRDHLDRWAQAARQAMQSV